MPPLTTEQLIELREELERELTRLRRSMRISEESIQPVELDQSAVGRLSRVGAMQSQAMQEGLQERQLTRYAGLEAAGRRMDEGTFGVCSECGADIPFGRLLVALESRTCTGCSEGS
jgi:DnaK suppressor protein